MPHAFRVGQLVALAQTSRDLETYEVVQLMPETPSGEPQYRIKGVSSGIVRAVREAEIKPHHSGPTPAIPFSIGHSYQSALRIIPWPSHSHQWGRPGMSQPSRRLVSDATGMGPITATTMTRVLPPPATRRQIS
jgi:hypothetical protein